MMIGSVGYGVAAAAFGALALLMLTSWRGRLQGGLLVAAAGISAAWAAAVAFGPGSASHWQLVVFLEISRNAAWLVFLARLTPAGQGLDGLARHLFSLAPAAAVFLLGIALAAAAGPQAVPAVTHVLILAGLVTAIAGLVLLEQAFRALRVAPRKQVLPLVVGLGGILAYDLFLYSHGLLFLGLHEDLWAARGFANLLAVPFLLLAARRNPAWSVDVFVSRHMAFYTTSLMGIGAYLLVMAVAGYGLRIAGGEWGFVLQVVFFFGALLVLAWVLFSPKARAALRVFLAKHFYTAKYDHRAEWIRLSEHLAKDLGDEALAVRGLGGLAEIVGADGAVLWGAGGDDAIALYHRNAVVGSVGSRDSLPGTLDPSDPVVKFLVERRWTVNLNEARRHPDSHPGLKLPAWTDNLGTEALIVPLLNRDRLWGFAALLNPAGVGRLSYEDIDLLRVAGMQVATVLAQAEADRLLTESRQFEAFSRFAAFIMHDLKNVIAQQSLVVRNAARYRDDPAFIDDALDTVANSVERMQRLLEQLKQGHGETRIERVDVARLVLETVSRHAHRDPIPGIELPADAIRLRVDRERLGAVLGHLVTNAQDATPPDGTIRIRVDLAGDGGLVIAIDDSGAGMDQEFIRERLFKPFDSTKDSKGMGIGAYQARQFVRTAGGDVRVTSEPGRGTRFELQFPAELVEWGSDAASHAPAALQAEASPATPRADLESAAGFSEHAARG